MIHTETKHDCFLFLPWLSPPNNYETSRLVLKLVSKPCLKGYLEETNTAKWPPLNSPQGSGKGGRSAALIMLPKLRGDRQQCQGLNTQGSWLPAGQWGGPQQGEGDAGEARTHRFWSEFPPQPSMWPQASPSFYRLSFSIWKRGGQTTYRPYQ